jgi:hypothetical protein
VELLGNRTCRLVIGNRRRSPGLPHRMLNWHYRSKHQSLIAVSNKQFYDNRLFIVPSPYDAVARLNMARSRARPCSGTHDIPLRLLTTDSTLEIHAVDASPHMIAEGRTVCADGI